MSWIFLGSKASLWEVLLVSRPTGGCILLSFWIYYMVIRFVKKLESDKIGNSLQISKANVASNNKIQSLHMWDLVHL